MNLNTSTIDLSKTDPIAASRINSYIGKSTYNDPYFKGRME